MMMRAITALALALAMLAAPLVSALAQDRQVMPVDEAVTDPTWVQFKKRLQSAIEKRDKQFVLAILDRGVRNQGQDAAGVAEFRKQWAIDASDSPLWRELASAMQLGQRLYQARQSARGIVLTLSACEVAGGYRAVHARRHRRARDDGAGRAFDLVPALGTLSTTSFRSSTGKSRTRRPT